MEKIIKKLNIPKCLLRYLMINFLDLKSIKTILLNIKCMNILDDNCKDFLQKVIKGFYWNCKKGNLYIAQWLYKSGGVDIHANDERAFKLSCMFGHIHVARWLYSLGGININLYDIEGFCSSCESGHLEVAQWLYSFGGITNFYVGTEYISSCGNGHLEVAQWLYSLGGVNIHAHDEYVFKLSCVNGHLEVAQWLYSLGEINIHAHSDYVFKNSKGDVLDWLKKLI